MSNKAIVFYTGELLEAQENSLREAHGVENIIFVPIETVKDLETKILETTERPFVVYNYLTNPELVLALCDKLLSFTSETGYEPEYFIWVDGTESNSIEPIAQHHSTTTRRKEKVKTSTNKSRAIVITEETLAKSLKLQTRKVDEGIEVIKLLIPAINEESVKHNFNDNIFRGYTKPTFVLIDDRHKYANVIAGLVNNMNVYRNIVTRIVDMRNQDLSGILFDQTNLEMRERLDKVAESKIRSAEAHYNKPGELHVDVSDMSMSDNIKAVKERVEKFKEIQTFKDNRYSMKDFDPNELRPDPYLSYGGAIEMCKRGIDVACVNWRADEFLTVNSGAMVHADNFWSPGNKRMAMAKADKQLAVFPHFLRTSPFGTVPYVPDFNDMFSEWVVSADRVKVKRVTIRSEEGFLKLTLNYGLDTFATSEFELAPFWIVYDVLADMAPLVTVIGDNKVSNLPAIVGAMKNAHDQRQRYVSQTFTLDENGLIDDRDNYSPYVQHHVIDQLGVTIERIKEGAYKHVVVDTDSFKTESQLEKIKEALQEAKVKWCSVSIKEQVYGIFG